MRIDEFDYSLPESSIAQHPLEPRDSSRLMVLSRRKTEIQHAIFRDIGSFLRSGDVLIFNDTRVLPARLSARKKETGGKAEILLIQRKGSQTWEVLVGGKKLRKGARLVLSRKETKGSDSRQEVEAEILEELGGPRRIIHFSEPITPQLDLLGEMPLPPYIHEQLLDPERYQTVYAKQPGSAAAPTAGLHFTPGLMRALSASGVSIGYVTLHVGLDTFAPITEEFVEDHAIHSEWIHIPETTAGLVNEAKRAGRRIVAVGTTSVRVLESAARVEGKGPDEVIHAWTGETRLFITPGFTFQVVDAMITNFHLPKSSLLLLVSAFAGWETIRKAYATAVQAKYRFYSFGDAMMIL